MPDSNHVQELDNIEVVLRPSGEIKFVDDLLQEQQHRMAGDTSGNRSSTRSK